MSTAAAMHGDEHDPESSDDALARLFGVHATSASPLPRVGPVSDGWVRAYLRVVAESGIAEKLASWREADRLDKGPGGRPAAVSHQAVLVLLYVLAHEHAPLLITRMAQMVEHRLSDEAKQLLGLPRRAASEGQWYHRIARSLTSLVAILDPYPGPRRQLLTKDELVQVLAERDPDVSRCKMQRLDWVCNQIVEASIRVQPRRIRRRWKGNACVDATVVPAWGKRGTSKRSDYVGIEYDAAWYVREGDHRDRSDAPGQKSARKVFWGWEATLAVMTANDPEQEADFPLLVSGIAFDKPGHAVAQNALKVFASIRQRGYPSGIAVGDLAYFPNSRPEALQLPLRALGYRIVSDFKVDQLGVKDQYAGALQVEGRFYCPAMPQPLIDATIDRRAAKAPISQATWEARIEQRTAYALRPKERPDADGSVPMMCPAAGPNPTVVCPLKPPAATRQQARALPVTVIHNPPAEPGRICTNKSSVTFPATAGAKYRQDMHFGSAEWRAAYSVPRNTIESANGYLKDSGHEKLDDPGRRRVRGYAAQYLLTAVLVASANIRKIAAFAANADAAGGQPMKKAQPKRRRDRLADYLPNNLLGSDPPAA